MKIPAVCALDFETKKIERRPDYPPVPVSVSIRKPGERKSKAYMWGLPSGNNCTFEQGRAAFLAACNDSRWDLLFQFGKFDLAVAAKHFGMKMPSWQRVHDTMFLLFLNEPHEKLGLKESAERLLGQAPEERDAVVDWLKANYKDKPKGDKWQMYISEAPGEIVGPYQNGDTDRTVDLFKYTYPIISQRGMIPAYNRERELMPILLANEQEGVRVDLPLLEHDIVLYTKALDAADSWLRKRLRTKDLNFDSNEEVADALERCRLVDPGNWVYTKPSKNFPGGQRSVSKENLTPDMIRDPKVSSMFVYRNKITTCLKTFMLPWATQARRTGGTIHTDWSQVRNTDRKSGAATGRMSCVHACTAIVTPDGLTEIKDVEVGTLVWTHKSRWRRVLATQIKGVEEMYDVTFSDGNVLTCTGDHKVLCLENEHIEGVVQQQTQPGIGATTVPRQGVLNEAGDSGSFRYGVSQCAACNCSAHAGAGTRLAESEALCEVETRMEKSDVWQERSEAPQLDWSCGRWVRIFDLLESRQTAVCPSYSDGASTRDSRASRLVHSSPHRRGQEEQRPGQLGADNEQWSQSDSCATKTGERCCTITSIEARGSHRVYDITVEEDASYAACGVFSHNSSPNFQNIPTDLEGRDGLNLALLRTLISWLPDLPMMRKYMLPDSSKHLWGKADYSQQELRLLDYFAEGSLGYAKNPKLDVHTIVTEAVRAEGLFTDIPIKAARNLMKRHVVFKRIYGGGVPAICGGLGCTKPVAERIIAAMLRAVPGYKEVDDAVKAEGRAGRCIVTWGGREYFKEPDRFDPDHGRVMDMSYKLTNYLIQGSAADVTKEAIIRYHNHPKRQARFLLSVHDELDISIPSAKLVKAELGILKECMESIEIDPPMVAEPAFGPRWSELKEVR